MDSTLFIVGTGPGDPKLLTLKAIDVLNQCPVIVSPKSSRNGSSTALSIVSSEIVMKEKVVHELHFPMMKIKTGVKPDDEVLNAWMSSAKTVIDYLEQGKGRRVPNSRRSCHIFNRVLSLSNDR